eukprot:763006-Hanusia_phi.AAC.8
MDPAEHGRSEAEVEEPLNGLEGEGYKSFVPREHDEGEQDWQDVLLVLNQHLHPMSARPLTPSALISTCMLCELSASLATRNDSMLAVSNRWISHARLKACSTPSEAQK